MSRSYIFGSATHVHSRYLQGLQTCEWRTIVPVSHAVALCHNMVSLKVLVSQNVC